MSQTERLYRLKSLLDAGRCVTRCFLLDEFGTSPATVKRDIAHLRDRMNAPVVFDRERGGWRLDLQAATIGTQYELPGLWLTAEEIHALLTMQHLLAHLDAGGLLGPHIAPLVERLDKLLGVGSNASAEVVRRIRVQTVGARKLHVPHFQAVGTALLQRRRLLIDYHGRGRNERREREVSPQRLIHYRDNWYLDAWCHVKRGLRSFAVDAVHTARMLDKPAIDVPDTDLDAVLGAGYGIFAGRDVQWATLRFTPERSRWVSAETWHPKQRGYFEADGHYRLELPYADPRELVMDILRHVPEVEVLGPAALREAVAEKLRQALHSINPPLAEKPGFSDADAEILKSILPKLFQNDAASARHDGSMEVLKVVWWSRNCKAGQHSSAKVHRSITVNPDGSIERNDLVGLTPEVVDGF